MNGDPVRTWPHPPAPEAAPRKLWNAIGRGIMCRCPNCGQGKLFASFLKTHDHCAVCGEAFLHHRADDLPAYLVIVVVGHIVVPLVLLVEKLFSPPVAWQLAIYLPLTLISCLALIQPTKGAVVGLQWAYRMHGFGDDHS